MILSLPLPCSWCSSADKIAKDSALTKVLNKAATNSYASNYSSGSSSANVMSQAGGPSPLGVESETELAWEAGFRCVWGRLYLFVWEVGFRSAETQRRGPRGV